MKNIKETSLKPYANPEQFWCGFLHGFTAPVKLPAMTPDLSCDAFHQKREIRFLSSQTEDLTNFAQNNQLSLFSLIQGAVALLLSRYTGETDILFGVATENNDLNNDLNILPVRLSIDDSASVLSWLREIQVQWSILENYQSTPLENIQKWSDIAPELQLFETVIIFTNNPKIVDFEQSKYPFVLVFNQESELLLGINYDPTQFADDAITRILGHLETLLKNIINFPEQTLANIPLLTEWEKHQLLVAWNQTQTDYPQEQCIHQLFEEQVEKTPDAIAVVFGRGYYQ